MFDNMPNVGKKGNPGSSNRRAPIVVGLLALVALLICLALAGLGAGTFWLQRPGSSLPEKLGLTSPSTSVTSDATTAPAASSSARATGKIAYSVFTGDSPEGKTIWVMNADGSNPKQILPKASSPTFSPDGKRIAFYQWNNGIFVANADGSNAQKILGETNAKYLAWSHDGKWIAFASQPIQKEGMNVNIDAVFADGSLRRTIVGGGTLPAWSPDDTQITFSSCRGSNCGILIASSLGNDGGRLIVGELGANPMWSPDGQRIVYQAEADGVKQLFVVNANGSGKRQLTTGKEQHVGATWSLDGNFIFYRATDNNHWGIYRMNADGSNPTRLIQDVAPVDWAYERLAVGK
ncbi:MAG: PD40 domain-containing protein [Chloroflexi bacterium]|nr:PD40 domain-containing protein [Chloroflexota bacterium]